VISKGNFCEAAAHSVIPIGWEDSPDGGLLRRDWRSFRIPSRRPARGTRSRERRRWLHRKPRLLTRWRRDLPRHCAWLVASAGLSRACLNSRLRSILRTWASSAVSVCCGALSTVPSNRASAAWAVAPASAMRARATEKLGKLHYRSGRTGFRVTRSSQRTPGARDRPWAPELFSLPCRGTANVLSRASAPSKRNAVGTWLIVFLVGSVRDCRRDVIGLHRFRSAAPAHRERKA
jgi:hypothetical protein